MTTAAGPDVAALAAAAAAEAGRWDRDGAVPAEVVRAIAAAGVLGLDLPARYGGSGADPRTLGQACAELGGACSALRSLVTVQGMVAAALLRWGDGDQRAGWLPALAGGDLVAGFAATEGGAGSELAAVSTSVSTAGDEVVVRGRKLWVTYGQRADVFLVLARAPGGPVTVLVESDRPGVGLEPVAGQLGLRAARLAHVRFDDVRVPARNVLAPPGFGLSHVVATALDHARFTVAWGCVGMAQACLDEATGHAVRRTQAGLPLSEHQLVRGLLARSLVATRAARALCLHAAGTRAAGEPDAIADTVVAKYAAARAAAAVSDDAVQIHGAAGCAPDSRVGRFFRDARVMRVIEGSDEVAEMHIADHALRRHAADAARPVG